MGKASRRTRAPRREPVPFVRRPFEGLPGETEWVAMREILPAATASVTVTAPTPAAVTVATVLPLTWAGLHRADDSVVIATQSVGSSGDASRDLAGQILAALAAPAGSPVPAVPAVTRDTPRLQDILDLGTPLTAEVHPGFEFWMEGQEIDEEARASIDQANQLAIPTVRMAAMTSAFWCRIGARTYIRIVLPDDETVATDGLARMHAAGEDAFGASTRLLGAFRAAGLLVPVVEIEPETEPAAYEDDLAAWATRYAAASATDAELSAAERRAKSGLLSRQVTLR